MGEGFSFIDIILLAMVAGFVLFRLRSVLGRRTGHEPQDTPAQVARRRPNGSGGDRQGDDNVINLPDREAGDDDAEAAAEPGDDSPVSAALTRIAIADRSFDRAGFLAGAQVAYEMIVNAFAAGDSRTLKPLLSDQVFDNFRSAIGQRESAGKVQETTLVEIKSAEIIDADLNGRIAEVTVKFVSEMITVTKDAAGRVLAGDATKVVPVTDIWTFAHNTRVSDPNWNLVATRSAN